MTSADNERLLIQETEEGCPDSQIGATLSALNDTIEDRRSRGDDSYTYRLLNGSEDDLLKKICEESLECALAAKDVEMSRVTGSADLDAQIDHLRYECGDVIYHIMVLTARYGIGLDELAAELNQRMKPEERPKGCVMLKEEHVKRRL